MKNRLLLAGALVCSTFGSAISLIPAQGAGAADVQVTNCNDSGSGSLRQAVLDAQPGDIISFALSPSCSTIALTSGQIEISNSVTIDGPGGGALAVSGSNQSRVFQIDTGATVSISGLTIEDGSAADEGGGVLNNGDITLTDMSVSNNTMTGNGHGGGGIDNLGTLTLVNSTLTGNVASGGSGGGIADQGTATISDSTISGNSASIDGGGICCPGTMTLTDSTVSDNTASNGAGIENGGMLTVSNTTITGNSDVGGGGAIFTIGGSVTVTSSTLSGNSNEEGYGIIQDNCCSVTLSASIVANSTGGPDCAGVSDGGYNLADDTSCGLSSANHDLPATNPDLGPLQNNGGPTETLLPASGSPAIGVIPLGTTLNGIQVCPRTDQRGLASEGNCTMGAVEGGGGFQITTTSLPNATPGEAYGPVTLSTQGAGMSTPPHVTSIKWAGVSLPTWLTLSSAGVLSGSPSNKLHPKTRSIKVSATEVVRTVNGNTTVKTKTTVEATIPLTVT